MARLSTDLSSRRVRVLRLVALSISHWSTSSAERSRSLRAPRSGITEVSAISALIAAVIALVAFAFQVRGLRRTLASSTYQNLVQQFNEYQRLMIDRPDLYKAIYKDKPGIQIHSETARQEVNWALGLLFNWYETAAIQSDRYKIIPRHVAKHWHQMLRHELRSPVLRAYWDTHGDYFHPALGEWARKELAQLPPP
jgi:hypothetical protein